MECQSLHGMHFGQTQLDLVDNTRPHLHAVKIKVCIQSHIQKLVLLVIMQLYIPAASVVVFTGNYTLIHQFDKVHKL